MVGQWWDNGGTMVGQSTEPQEPRPDGICCRCCDKPAVTTDKLFCLRCLRKLLRDANPIVDAAIRERRGRSARSTEVLGGCADMRDYRDQQE